jgi:uncharacterized protein YoxC
MEKILIQINKLIENVGFENSIFLLFALGMVFLCYYLIKMQSKSQGKLDLIAKDAEECKSDREALRLELQQTKIRNEQLNKYNKEARRELSQSKASLDTVVNTFNDTIKMLIDKV